MFEKGHQLPRYVARIEAALPRKQSRQRLSGVAVSGHEPPHALQQKQARIFAAGSVRAVTDLPNG
jgi:hypothetical protein